ncbi:MAG: insulinase family protein [Bacteroidales bacterium]|nr:insulinase family protein [Bacteroidales bacterium]
MPAIKREESWKDLGLHTPEGMIDTSIYKGSDPKSIVIAYFEDNEQWNEKDEHLMSVLSGILDRIYVDVIREEKAGAYTVQASGGLAKVPYQYAYLRILIPCSPDNTDSLTIAAINEIKRIQENGVKPEDLKTAKEIERREIEKESKTNGYWISALSGIYFQGKTMDKFVKLR